MPGSVIVPVLSTHNTSTRDKVSMLFMSCKRTFFVANRMVPSAKATVASKYNPSGIMPITAATAAVTLRATVSSL